MKLGSEQHHVPLKGQIQDLVELAFQEIRAFGVFSSHVRPTRKCFEEYIQNHITDINALIQTAEEHRNLIPGNNSRPILYNYRSWPENAPLAGYYTFESGIKYSHLLTTYVANWHYESSNGPLHSRLLRAALYVWCSKDLNYCVNYIFDLQKYGYFMIPEAIEQVIALLIRSQALGKSSQEVISAYFKGKIPLSSPDWLTWEIEEPGKLLEGLDPVNVQSLLEPLIFDTLEKLECARDLNIPEEWLLEQSAAMLRCRTILILCSRFLEEDLRTVALKSILDQFDEIVADAGIYMWYQHRPKFAPLSSPMSMQIAPILWSFRQKLGEEGEARLYQERLLYPGVLREQIALSDGETFPQEWSIIPPRLLWPFAMSINQGHLDPAGRTRLFPPEQVEQVLEVRNFFEKSGINLQEDRIRLLNEVYLWKVPDACKTGGSPGVQLSDEQSTQLTSILQESHRSFCLKELIEENLNTIYRSNNLGKEEQERILKKVSVLYPWSPAVYLELAIYHDENGNHLLAWDYILTALLLYPNYDAGWHAASIILGRLGNDAEADFAWAVYTVTKKGAGK